MRSFLFLTFFISLFAGLHAQSGTNIEQVGRFQYFDRNTNDIWGYVDSAGTEYALVGTTKGLSIVSLQDPRNPVEVFTEDDVNSIWRDVKTWNGFAYVTNETARGLSIYDLRYLPDSVPDKQIYLGDTIPFFRAHNIWIDENGVAYIFGALDTSGSQGTIMLDLNTTDPYRPRELGHFVDYYVHDGFVRGDTLWAAAVWEGIFSVIDVSDKAKPVIMAEHPTPSTFTHNVWPSDDGNTLYTTDEVSAAYVAAYDVSNLQAIQELDRFRSRDGADVIPHNTHVFGDHLVTSFYTSGVIVTDATYPDNLIEIGTFDTSPLFNGGLFGGTFNGNWGAYPYLPSGLLIVSDIEEGLYVLDAEYKKAAYIWGEVRDCNGALVSDALFEIQGTDIRSRSNILGAFKTGIADAGEYDIRVSAAGKFPLIMENVQLDSARINNLSFVLQDSSIGLNGSLSQEIAGNALSNAIIELTASQQTYSISTDSLGGFNLGTFNGDTYDLRWGKWGFESSCSTAVDLNCPPAQFDLELAQGYRDNFELDLGWSTTGSEAKGKWTRAIPEGTVFDNQIANPGQDIAHDCGGEAYVTGNGFGPAENNDVDSITTLTSPIFDLQSYLQPYISFHLWFFNGGVLPNDEVIVRLIDANGAIFNLDTISALDPMSRWEFYTYKVADFAAINTSYQLQIVVDDQAPAHILEVGFDNFSISEGEPIGIAENQLANDLLTYPNPFKNELVVDWTAWTEAPVSIAILDELGRSVYQTTLAGNDNQLKVETTTFPSGLYLLQIQFEDGSLHSKKLIRY